MNGEANQNPHQGGRILVVTHKEEVANFIAGMLQTEGHRADPCLSPMESLGRLKLREYDVIVCQLPMEMPSSGEFLELLGLRHGDSEVILMVSPQDKEAGHAAMKWVAWDYLVFPDDTDEIPLRIRRAVEFVRLKRVKGASLQNLDGRFRVERERICSGFYDTMKSVVHTLESKDIHYQGHCKRVREYGLWISREMGLDPVQEAETALASDLHDIGYVGIHDSIPAKRGRLDENERATIRGHVELGLAILKPILPERSLQFIRHHHERWDGTGYPLGLHENLIPLGSRIIAVADAFDAMTSPRAYRSASAPADALAEIRGKAGSQFDPFLVPAFVEAVEERLERHPHLIKLRGA